MMTSNTQSESVYRQTPSHVTPSTQPSAEPRSTIYSASVVPTSIQPAASTTASASSSRTNSVSARQPASSTDANRSVVGQNQQAASQSLGNNSIPPTTGVNASSTMVVTVDGRQSSQNSPRRSSQEMPPAQQQPIKLKDLAHLIELAQEDVFQMSQSPARRNRRDEERKRYEISGMPVTDVIEMVAGLLTKITTTNDRTNNDMHRGNSQDSNSGSHSGTSSSILAFHGKNVPSITIQSYLSRIHKYCPTSYEVFLSLLVYFDRMTEKVNQNVGEWRAQQNRASSVNSPPVLSSPLIPQSTGSGTAGTGATISGVSVSDAYNTSQFFVVDSFNIHRLVIAGVTCASKFFSDIFYTNSRYAKVGLT